MFEIYQDKAGEFRFRLVAKNGETVLASEGYKTKASCKKGIQSVIKNIQREGGVEFKEAKNGKAFFNVKSTNGQVVGSSQMYATMRGAKCGVRSVKTNALKMEISDTTK